MSLAPQLAGATGDGLFLPGTFGEEYDLDAAKSYGNAMLFREWLKEIDPRLDIAWAKAGAENLTGNRWYIVRRNEGAPNSYWVIEKSDGSYSDPGPEHIEMLHKMDSSKHPGGWLRYRNQELERQRARDKSRAERHREFAERLEERLKSIYDTSVSVTPAMKARADGANVTEGGLVLPAHVNDHIERAAQEVTAEPVREALVDDATAAGGVDDFMVLEDVARRPNRAERRKINKRNKALTKARSRLVP